MVGKKFVFRCRGKGKFWEERGTPNSDAKIILFQRDVGQKYLFLYFSLMTLFNLREDFSPRTTAVNCSRQLVSPLRFLKTRGRKLMGNPNFYLQGTQPLSALWLFTFSLKQLQGSFQIFTWLDRIIGCTVWAITYDIKCY